MEINKSNSLNLRFLKTNYRDKESKIIPIFGKPTIFCGGIGSLK